MPHAKINLFENKFHRIKDEMWKSNLLKNFRRNKRIFFMSLG